MTARGERLLYPAFVKKQESGRARQGQSAFRPAREVGRHWKSKKGQKGQKGARNFLRSFRPFLPFLPFFALKPPQPVSTLTSMN
jgi:hypothetical protein